MATRKELKATLDEMGVEYKAKASHAELKKLVAEAEKSDGPGVARVGQKFVTVQAPPSWAGNSWHPAFLTAPLRFNADAQAPLLVEQAGELVVFEFMGADGQLEQVPVADKVAEHPDLEVDG